MRTIKLAIINRSLFFFLCAVQICAAQGILMRVAPALPSLPVGWLYVQDNGDGDCTGSGSNASCAHSDINATVAGSAWIMCVQYGGNSSINSITGGGGSWTNLTATKFYDSTNSFGGECAVNFTGTTGTSSLTITLDATSVAFEYPEFIEILPPAGYTASVDTSSFVNDAPCTTCSGVGLTLTATDAVVQILNYGDAFLHNVPNIWTGNYFYGQSTSGFSLNTTDGTAPSVTQDSSAYADFMAVALKSTAAKFTVPAPLASFPQLTVYGAGGQFCNTVCTITIPSTTAGDLIFIQEANLNGVHITAVSGGGSWTIPTGANTCQTVTTDNESQSCAYNVSVTGGTTSINVTTSTVSGFLVYQVHRTSGSWAFDAQNSLTQAAGGTNPVSCPTLTISGQNDVIFQGITNSGAAWVASPNYYPFYDNSGQWGNAVLQGNASGAMGLNMTQYYQCTWVANDPGANAIGLYTIAFK